MIITLAPCLILMAAVYYRNEFRNPVIKFIALPLFLGGGLIASYLFIQNIGNQMQSYSLDSMQKTAEGFKSWHTTLGGSRRNLRIFFRQRCRLYYCWNIEKSANSYRYHFIWPVHLANSKPSDAIIWNRKSYVSLFFL